MTPYTQADVLALWRCAREHNCTIPDEALDAMRDALAAPLRQAPGGVTEAMVDKVWSTLMREEGEPRASPSSVRTALVELFGYCQGCLGIGGENGMACPDCNGTGKAALSAQQGQGELQPEDSRCPPTYRREEAVKALIGMGWLWDGKQWTAPPAQRVPEAMPERTDMDGYSNGYVKGWNDCRERTIAASTAPSPARGDGGEG